MNENIYLLLLSHFMPFQPFQSKYLIYHRVGLYNVDTNMNGLCKFFKKLKWVQNGFSQSTTNLLLY